MCREEIIHDEKWIAFLMREYYTDMFNYGKRFCRNEEIIKDSIQEIFISLWQRRNNANEILNAKFYFLRAIKNKILKALDSTARVNKMQALYCDYDFIYEFPVDKEIVLRETSANNRNRLHLILANLPKREQEAVYLKFYQKLDNAQIADLMNINRQSVYNLLSASILKLRDYWQKEFVH